MATYTRSKKTRSHMESGSIDSIAQVLDDFNAVTKAPEKFISPQAKTASKLSTVTKQLFDLSQQNLTDNYANLSGLTELIVDNFDDEQIWQEIELHNDPFLKHSFQDVAKVIASKDRCTFFERTKLKSSTVEDEDGDGNEEEEEDEENLLEYSGSQDLFPEMQTEEEDGDEENESDDESGSETNFDIDALENKSKSKTRKKRAATTSARDGNSKKAKTSVVDDQFFKLSEMDKFLEFEDAKEERRRDEEEGKGKRRKEGDEDDDDDDDDSIDYFKELPSDDDAGLEEDDDDDDEDDKDEEVDLFKNAKDFVYKDFFPGEGDDEEASTKADKSVRFEDSDEMMGEEEEEGEEDEEEEEEDGEDEDEDEAGNDKSGHDAAARQALSGLLRDSDDGSEGEDALDILGRKPKDEEDESKKSTFEKRQDRLKEKINQLEEANIAKKPWQLMGEVKGTKRPDNSLLEVDLEFDATPKAGVEVTEETTKSLEDIIRQRILDTAWDDVERKMKPKEDIHEYKKQVTLNQEKSKVSLAEIYEQEYIKQTQDEKEAEEDPAHIEIKTSMESLFLKLDALSNFHYTPKPAVPEVKIISNLPSITIEEVAPITATDATLLAPQEIQEKQKGELKGDTEKTETDKNRARREKKLRQRAREQEKEKREKLVDKLNPGLGNKYSKRAAMERLEKSSKVASNRTTIIKDPKSSKKSLTSSKSFFSQLQDEVTAQVHGLGSGKKKTNKIQMSSARLKL